MKVVRPPVVLLGGEANVLAVARSLGRDDVQVHVSARAGNPVFSSRHCHHRHVIPAAVEPYAFWGELLLADDRRELEGALVLALNDDALEFVAACRSALADRYLLDHFEPEQIRAMLDKRTTMELARAAGVPTPRFWQGSELERSSPPQELEYPLMIKPRHSHRFQRAFPGHKYLLAADRGQLDRHLDATRAHGLEVMVMEWIPGPDTELSSYFTYITPERETLVRLTKGVIRRFPVGEGGASYHVSARLPATAELGQRFFDGIRYVGLGNVEFKRDPRDGELKIMECNPRFTDSHQLLVAIGVDTARVVYAVATGAPLPALAEPRDGVTLLNVLRDLAAYRQLRARGEITLTGWLGSLLRPQVFQVWSLTDPGPATSELLGRAGAHLRRSDAST